MLKLKKLARAYIAKNYSGVFEIDSEMTTKEHLVISWKVQAAVALRPTSNEEEFQALVEHACDTLKDGINQKYPGSI